MALPAFTPVYRAIVAMLSALMAVADGEAGGFAAPESAALLPPQAARDVVSVAVTAITASTERADDLREYPFTLRQASGLAQRM
ncbi:hypothetical protein Vau01_001220 [Virgisporangium aurantiacum]|uniref:Uncharacterized protein n=1 Tax=Virgisporangium aurantiacum TaxID=175570 RepID=A0A8J3YW00_9ACTN|nr:hypothetical protein Vau01_001220 [Virgisporangium aurantiacum]